MNISEMIDQLCELKDAHGDLPFWISGRYEHYEINYLDWSESNTNLGKEEHICIKLKQD